MATKRKGKELIQYILCTSIHELDFTQNQTKREQDQNLHLVRVDANGSFGILPQLISLKKMLRIVLLFECYNKNGTTTWIRNSPMTKYCNNKWRFIPFFHLCTLQAINSIVLNIAPTKWARAYISVVYISHAGVIC